MVAAAACAMLPVLCAPLLLESVETECMSPTWVGCLLACQARACIACISWLHDSAQQRAACCNGLLAHQLAAADAQGWLGWMAAHDGC